ncbi:hypothetical protein EII14_01590 [Alloprevotella sp. OH1205_COT-284]|uniref:formate/nitrite transporter family protein n=1 Tax=Alloprevotella sp. OH1205_COT-284 TaxID=2491043 RepID=UPI000F5E0EFE|nr:formate/nitrite transporter family protein [Alloprevotella sp. OH1205_COT-284]RRD80514.1 hypothetical protein EII14_01590 [Alloprevotella sp. OH1205_COT-284]
MQTHFDLFRVSVAAGAAIGLAGFAYLAVGGVPGAVLFTFGLLSIVGYRLKLYTSRAGFIHRNEGGQLAAIFLYNAIGCLLVALLTRASSMPINEAAQHIIEKRLANGILNSGLLSIACGVIMTVAVTFGYRNNFLPLLFGVPLFILCGFPHCMADTFYILTCPTDFLLCNIDSLLLYLPAITVGNFIGCNLPRLFPKPFDPMAPAAPKAS